MPTPLQKSKPPRSKSKPVLVGQPILAVPFLFPATPDIGIVPRTLRSSASLRYPFPLSTFNFRLSTSLSPPPMYNELASWLPNLACLMARAPANSLNPAHLASLSATPSLILLIPPSPPPAPATPPASSAPKKSPTSSASPSAPPLSTAAITPSTSTPISNPPSKPSPANSSAPSSTPPPFII